MRLAGAPPKAGSRQRLLLLLASLAAPTLLFLAAIGDLFALAAPPASPPPSYRPTAAAAAAQHLAENDLHVDDFQGSLFPELFHTGLWLENAAEQHEQLQRDRQLEQHEEQQEQQQHEEQHEEQLEQHEQQLEQHEEQHEEQLEQHEEQQEQHEEQHEEQQYEQHEEQQYEQHEEQEQQQQHQQSDKGSAGVLFAQELREPPSAPSFPDAAAARASPPFSASSPTPPLQSRAQMRLVCKLQVTGEATCDFIGSSSVNETREGTVAESWKIEGSDGGAGALVSLISDSLSFGTDKTAPHDDLRIGDAAAEAAAKAAAAVAQAAAVAAIRYQQPPVASTYPLIELLWRTGDAASLPPSSAGGVYYHQIEQQQQQQQLQLLQQQGPCTDQPGCSHKKKVEPSAAAPITWPETPFAFQPVTRTEMLELLPALKKQLEADFGGPVDPEHLPCVSRTTDPRLPTMGDILRSRTDLKTFKAMVEHSHILELLPCPLTLFAVPDDKIADSRGASAPPCVVASFERPENQRMLLQVVGRTIALGEHYHLYPYGPLPLLFGPPAQIAGSSSSKTTYNGLELPGQKIPFDRGVIHLLPTTDNADKVGTEVLRKTIYWTCLDDHLKKHPAVTRLALRVVDGMRALPLIGVPPGPRPVWVARDNPGWYAPPQPRGSVLEHLEGAPQSETALEDQLVSPSQTLSSLA